MNIFSKITIFSCIALSGVVFADQKPIPGCEASSAPAARSCLASLMNESERILSDSEYKALDAVKNWNEASSIAAQVESRLVATAKTFRVYRNAQCGLVASLGSAIKRIELDNNQLSCIYELNVARTNHLSQIIEGLPQR